MSYVSKGWNLLSDAREVGGVDLSRTPCFLLNGLNVLTYVILNPNAKSDAGRIGRDDTFERENAKLKIQFEFHLPLLECIVTIHFN
jgi:hypothetical protein